MKEIKTKEELEELYSKNNVIIEFGLAEGCIPCKMTKNNLSELENTEKFDLSYYFCSNTDIISELGYSTVPVIMLIKNSEKNELQDSSISMDLEELTEWIESF